jgi:ubiquinone/menaquinone biosynthesis C-methylase UbiE
MKVTHTTSWGGVSDWYDSLVESEDSYQAKVIAPNLRRLLGDLTGKHLLDLACGQGYFSRVARDLGAEVTAADMSKELVLHAKKKDANGIEYHVAPAHELGFLADQSQDVVLCVLAFQNIENITEVLKEISRVLKPDGKILLVLNHPAFRIPKGSDWGYDTDRDSAYRREDLYLSEKKIAIDMHPGRQEKEQTITFHRSLQYFFKLFSKQQLGVTRLEEWISHKESQAGPRKKAEDKARKEFPLFLMLELRKFNY